MTIDELESLWGEDFPHVFNYAKEFSRNDVKEVLHQNPGFRDYNEWVVVLLLKNGKFAYLTAWCDYTGWG